MEMAVAPKPARAIDASAWLANLAPNSDFPLARIAAGKTSPLLWGADSLPAERVNLIGKLHKATLVRKWKGEAAELARFLAQTVSSEPSTDHALEILAWAYLLPVVKSAELLQQLFAWHDAVLASATPATALPQLLLKVELPLLLALAAPDLKTATALRKGAIGAESRVANAWIDPLGLPSQARAELLRPWLATIIRAQELLRNSEVQFSDTARERLEKLTRHVLRLSRPDGGSTLGPAAGSTADRELLTAAVIATNSNAALAQLALGKGAADKKPAKGTPPAAFYSQKSSFAVLRNRWAAPQTQATFDFSGDNTWLDVSCGNQSLLHGNWDVALKVNDTALTPLGPWTDVCWHADPDCDYLEIERKFSGGWLLQRHVMIVRQDECLLLADSLLDETKRTPEEFLATAAQAPRLDYSTSLQLPSSIAFAPQQDTREGYLQAGRKPLGLVMPIALPEWRKQPSSGELSVNGSQLQHRLQTRGRNLFAPLWIDLNPNRFKNAECTWRQLTIGEFLQVQPREVAVGFRVQVRYSNWLLYRSLAWRGNRTVLGKNFATDFACSRFQPNGETQEILEVQ
ncbi:hypothetical protein [Anatilimnocola floriformis]|uniref:hypothetical protein n=1 Tax=Anatilimnocola floriformis TaxID=2948575 RepID=UPI0020C2B597|nr:hypothetical protein [Anatilimnocola floriformis]